jgi:hypothetical protein
MQTVVMPSAFAELVPLAAKWALPTENQRSQIRWNASLEDFSRLYQAVMPRLPEIMALLASYPVDNVPAEMRSLYLLTCAFAEAAPHHELYKGSNQVPHSFEASRFRAMHGDTAD